MSTLARKIGHVAFGTARWIGTEWSAWSSRELRGLAPDAPTMLLLAWFFPPMVSGGTYRPLSLVRHGSALGWRFMVVSGLPSKDPESPGQRLLELVPRDTKVTRIPEAGRPFFGVDGGFLTAMEVVAGAKRLLGTIRPSVVLASGPPFMLFVAGRYLARHYRVPLVLDYRDEWTQCPFEFVRTGRVDPWWERRTLSSADLVIFTTESQRANQLSAFPGLDGTKCVVAPNGWDPADGYTETAPSDHGSDGPTLAFVGNLGDHTPPDAFLDTLTLILNRNPCLKATLNVTFVGQKSPSTLQRLEAFAHRDVLSVLDQVSKERAMEIMRRARGLLILNDQRLVRYLPGKIYEYLATRRPILVFGEGGEVGALVRHLQAGVVVPHGDADTLERFFEELLRDRTTTPTSPHLDAWLRRHTRGHLAQELLTTIASCVGEAR